MKIGRISLHLCILTRILPLVPGTQFLSCKINPGNAHNRVPLPAAFPTEVA
jgi:hypothetical protein